MRAIGIVAAFVVAALAVPASVLAHAEPARVVPGNGAVLTSPPASVEIEMTQEMARQEGANDIDVVAADGTEVTQVAAVIDNGNRKRLSVDLPRDLAPGTYTVRWKTLSAEDGDTDSGELSFTYDPQGTASAGQEQLQEELVPDETQTPGTDGGTAPVVVDEGGDDGFSWVLLTAVGVGMFVLGGGTTFLLIQKRP